MDYVLSYYRNCRNYSSVPKTIVGLLQNGFLITKKVLGIDSPTIIHDLQNLLMNQDISKNFHLCIFFIIMCYLLLDEMQYYMDTQNDVTKTTDRQRRNALLVWRKRMVKKDFIPLFNRGSSELDTVTKCISYIAVNFTSQLNLLDQSSFVG